jgi:ATP-dependent helicase/nuclease subunit A
MSLTPEQRGAIERWGQDVCVVAGPGSGKTTVLVERYAWLIQERKFRPGQILSITFTEKAAQEIKERLTARFAADPGVRHEIERAPVATIHGFGARLLRRYAIPAGLDPQFTILDEVAMKAELHSAIKATLDRLAAERRSDLRMLFSAWNSDTPVEHLADLYEAWRSSGGRLDDLVLDTAGGLSHLPLLAATDGLVGTKAGWAEWRDAFARSPLDFALLDRGHRLIKGARGHAARLWRLEVEAYRVAALATYFAPARELLVSMFSELVRDVERRKFERGVLDFGDLESRTIALLEAHPEIQARVRDEYEAILMDELQDTNPLQWRLMNLVRREGRFFGVGDLNQSIFGFRHATPESFRQYRQGLLEALQEVDELRGNYRSREEILRAAMEIVADAPGLEPPLLEARRSFPVADGPVVEALAAEGETPLEREQLEAEHVARRIQELHAAGTSYSSMALLFRQTTGLNVFEQALRSFGVPYVMNLGRGFFEAIEVTDLVNWLRIVANPRDEIALVGVLRSPLAGYSDEAIYAMRLRGASDPLPDGRGSIELPEEFAGRLRTHRAMADEVSPDRLLACAIDESGYALGLDAAARANVDKLLTLVREWWAVDPRPIAELVQRLDERALEREPNAPAGDGSDAVNVMTMHSAKGLEFPVVFLCGLQRTGGSGRSAPVSFSTRHGLGLTWRDPATGDAVHDPVHRLNLDAEKEREEAEANRLLYVGMTRAEDRLFFSWCEGKQQRSKWPEMVRRCFAPQLVAVPPDRWDLAATAVPAAEPLLLRPIRSDEPWNGSVTVDELCGCEPDPEATWDFLVEIGGVIVTGAARHSVNLKTRSVQVFDQESEMRAGVLAAILGRAWDYRPQAFFQERAVPNIDPEPLVEAWKRTFVRS